ncbi:ATP-binding protein [Flagellimonas pacifica]|uniref:histidine kinase n=1 Tax=Flagellimonas pacifica TaxID=1247520 RepID=A0A285MU93_9FLAO|nr:ATP-binding protein [Allomuricauda parva]SNZ00698.1 Histidine kinase-, DNA gyrase B-, and HSP90-like ATPase [Allomuricauda parva]
MKNKALTLFLILLACCGKQTRDQTVVDTPESVLINKWINIARDSTQLSMDERKQYLVKATEKASDLSNDTISLDHLSRVSLAYKRLQDSTGFRNMNQEVMDLSGDRKIYKALGESHWDLAAFFKSYGVMDSAYFHYKKAYKGFDQMPVDSTSLSLRGRILYSMGRIQNYFKDYLGAEVNITEALRIFEDLEDYKRLYNCNNILGITAQGMNNSTKSLEYFKKAGADIGKFNSIDKTSYMWENKNNIAYDYLRNMEYSKSANAYLELYNDKSLSVENPALYSKVLTSRGYSIFKGEKDFGEAKKMFQKAISLNDSISLSVENDQARAKQYYAELLATEGDSTLAKQYAKESLAIAKETSNNDHHLEVLRLLTTIDAENAVAYSNEYYTLNEQIKDEERAIRDKFARIRLETDEVIQRNELLSKQKQIWTGVALGLLLLGAAFFIIVSQRISNNKLKFEQKQQESNQEIYNLMLSQHGKLEEGKQLEQKRISEELHDGVLGEMLGIRLILSKLNNKDDEASVQFRAQLIEKLQEQEEEIRTISHELSDASYQKFYNFIVSLEDLINNIGESSGISCSFTYAEGVEWDNLDGDIKINIYRIVQESLQNCVKHAQCHNAKVAFEIVDNLLELKISDDGVGFDTGKGKGKRGIGLRNVISRVKKMNGTLNIDSKKGKGTTITVTLPYDDIRPEDPKYI